MQAREALAQWERDGLIAPELAATLRATLDVADRAERSVRLIGLLVGLGAVLIGGGLLLFIASHWDSQSPVRRVLLLVLVYAVVVGAAALADRQRLATTGRGLWFLSSLTVGVDIFLLGQIFNLPLNYWQGTGLWMLAALAMGWASPSAAHGWLVVVLGTLTLGWVSVPSAQFFDQAAFLWDPAGIRPVLPLIGLALAAAAMLAAGTGLAFLEQPSRVLGVLAIAVPVTLSTFHPYLFAGVWEMDAGWLHLELAAASLAVVGWSWFRHRHVLAVWVLAALAVLMAVLLIQVDVGRDAPSSISGFRSTSWLAQPAAESAVVFGAYTAVIFALALATVIAGQRLQMPVLVNGGLGAVVVMVMGVYIGRVAGTLPTAIAVLVGGVLLVGGGGFLERKRRDLLAPQVPA